MTTFKLSEEAQALLSAARDFAMMRRHAKRRNGHSVNPVEQRAMVRHLERQLIERALELSTDEPVSG